MSKYQKVTMINDLPDLDDTSTLDSYHKHIRLPNIIPEEAGMTVNTNQSTVYDKHKLIDTLNCATIAEHVRLCPICTKFYNNDNTVYIVVIILLLIMCVLLFSRTQNRV